MAQFDLAAVSRIAQAAVREQALPLEVVGIVPAVEGDDYVEILVNIDRCPSEPCRFAIGAFRNSSEATLQRAIGTTLRDHLNQLEPQRSAEGRRLPSEPTDVRAMTADEMRNFEAHELHHEPRDVTGPASETNPRDDSRGSPVLPIPNPD